MHLYNYVKKTGIYDENYSTISWTIFTNNNQPVIEGSEENLVATTKGAVSECAKKECLFFVVTIVVVFVGWDR